MKIEQKVNNKNDYFSSSPSSAVSECSAAAALCYNETQKITMKCEGGERERNGRTIETHPMKQYEMKK